MHSFNRQLRYTRQHEFRWTEVELPAVTDRSSAVVRPIVIARSDADAVVLCPASQKSAGRFQVPDPVTALKTRFENLSQKMPLPRRHTSAGVGQQGIAEVVQVGPDVAGLEIGQFVILTPQSGAAAPIVGDLQRFDAAPGWLSDLVLVPDAGSKLLPLPADLDPILMCAAGGDLMSAWNALEPQIKPAAQTRVLIVGGIARSTALYSVALAASLGAAQIDYADHSGERAAIAESLGARSMEPVNRRRKSSIDQNYNLVICGSTDKTVASSALQQLLPGGVFVQLPPFKLDGIRIPLSLIYHNRLSIAMSAEASNTRMQALLAHVQKKSVPLGNVLTHRAEFDDAPQHLFKNTTSVVLWRAAIHSQRKLNPG